MGIRVKKILGYALLDVKTKDYSFADDRFTEEFSKGSWRDYSKDNFIHFLQEKYDPSNEFSEEKLLAYFLGRYDEESSNAPWDVNKFVHYDFEYGSKKTVIFLEPNSCDWYRSDDIIDYYQENCQPKIKIKKLNGIFPYCGIYTNLKSGQRIAKDNGKTLVDIIQMYINTKITPPDVIEELIKKLGFKDFEEYKENIVPYVSDSIRLFCEFLNVFKDPKTINYLKPVLYTYWS